MNLCIKGSKEQLPLFTPMAMKDMKCDWKIYIFNTFNLENWARLFIQTDQLRRFLHENLQAPKHVAKGCC